MKNLKQYNESSIDFYNLVVCSKRNPHLKQRLSLLTQLIKISFEDYDNKFANNNLRQLKKTNSQNCSKSDFDELYKFRSKPFQDFLINLRSIQEVTIANTCQYCTINSHHTLDHFLPKSDYWEYIAHPKNLIPSCSDCNSRRGYEADLSLNLYLDQLPELQYLFVDIFLEDEDINFEFYIKNINGINQIIYNKIIYHFKELNLLERMKLSAINHFTEFYNLVINQLRVTDWENIKLTTVRSVYNNKNAYGHNHWKYILQESLINNEVFKIKCLGSI
ncbi:MAG: HNH endonuclease [Burkholderiales bacterium]|nr:HNH endonuclease [Burkholderiales bacterium]